MLVLTRKKEETLYIGNNITLTILKIKGNSVQIGVEAPRNVRVLRGELASRIDQTPSASESTEPASAAAPAAKRNRLRELASQVRGEAEKNCLLQLV